MNLWVCVGGGIGGVFWSVFVRGKCTRSGRIGWKGVKKLFIDRLGRIKSSSVGCQ